MESWTIVLIAILSVLAGFFLGLIFQNWRGKRARVVGNLVVYSDSNEKAPYIYLQLNKDVELVRSKKTVLLNVVHISHK